MGFLEKECFLGQFYGYARVVRVEIDGLVICGFFVGGIQRCSLDPRTYLRWRAILRSPPSSLFAWIVAVFGNELARLVTLDIVTNVI